MDRHQGKALQLKEHEGKKLFREFGIPTNDGFIATKPDHVGVIDRPMVVKAQVATGGRGKAGGIRFASSQEQVRNAVVDLIGKEIGGHKVSEVLIEERVNVDREIYLSIYIDRRSKLPTLMLIGEGGVDVETADPSSISTWPLNPFVGVPDYVAREAAMDLVLDTGPAKQLADILERMWQLFWKMDCELVEINPLVKTYDGKMLALDSKVLLDEDASFRHLDIIFQETGRSPLEDEARKLGMSLVQMDGDVGVIANGAGLTMATLDVLALHGARGGAFLDLGGTDDNKVIEGAVSLVSKLKPRVILVNIFGGITKCDTVAEGIIMAKESHDLGTELVVRVRGVNEGKARDMLIRKGIEAVHDLDEACIKAAKVRGA